MAWSIRQFIIKQAEDKNTGGIVAIKINFNIISKEQQYIEIGLLKIMRDYTRLPFLHTVIQKKDSYSIIMDYHKSKPFIVTVELFRLSLANLRLLMSNTIFMSFCWA